MRPFAMWISDSQSWVKYGLSEPHRPLAQLQYSPTLCLSEASV